MTPNACVFCEDPITPDDATEQTVGGACHAECATNERDFALVKAVLR